MFWKKKKWEPTLTFTKIECQKIPIDKWKASSQLKQTKIEPEPVKKEAPKSKELLFSKLTNDWEKEFLDTFKQLTYTHRPWDVWRDFIIMYACAISNAVDKTHFDDREKRYLSIVKKYTNTEQKLFPDLCAYISLALEDNPEQDFLGKIFMALNLGNASNGQFFTPYSVCQLMADVVTDDVEERIEWQGYISINDSCCGEGAIIIAAANSIRKKLENRKHPLNFQNHVLVVAQDVDEIVGLMCYIQVSLLGLAGYVKIGNSLTDPISGSDSHENYWYTPLYFADTWVMRRTIKKLDELCRR